MEAEHFDTELFIVEVEKRRCIWDMECEDYKNRVLRRSAWQELVDIFAGENSTLEEKKVLGNTLQKKWKHVRDNFSRELKKQTTLKSGSGSRKSNSYIYFQRLMFLKPTLINKSTTSNLDSHLEDETEGEDLLPGPSKPSSGVAERNLGSNKKFKMNPVDKQFFDILNKSVAAREEREVAKANEDEDKLFCMSLYKELQKVPEHGRIHTKIQLLEVIQGAQDFYNPSHAAHAYPLFPSHSYNQFDYAAKQQRKQHPPDSFSGHGFNSQSASAQGTPLSKSLLAAAAANQSNLQRSQLQPIQSDGFSGQFSQPAAAAGGPLSQSLLAEAALSPTGSMHCSSETSSDFSDIYK